MPHSTFIALAWPLCRNSPPWRWMLLPLLARIADLTDSSAYGAPRSPWPYVHFLWSISLGEASKSGGWLGDIFSPAPVNYLDMCDMGGGVCVRHEPTHDAAFGVVTIVWFGCERRQSKTGETGPDHVPLRPQSPNVAILMWCHSPPRPTKTQPMGFGRRIRRISREYHAAKSPMSFIVLVCATTPACCRHSTILTPRPLMHCYEAIRHLPVAIYGSASDVSTPHRSSLSWLRKLNNTPFEWNFVVLSVSQKRLCFA